MRGRGVVLHDEAHAPGGAGVVDVPFRGVGGGAVAGGGGEEEHGGVVVGAEGDGVDGPEEVAGGVEADGDG